MSELATTTRDELDAERIARDLVVPSQGRPYDHVAPLSRQEVPLVRAIVQRLTAKPGSPREAIRNAADLVDMAGASSSRFGAELRAELDALARRHPADFAEVVGGDLPEDCVDAMIDGGFAAPLSVKAAFRARVRMIRDELAGPRPSPVEWHLAEAAALAWFDFYRCMMHREQAGAVPLRQLSYYDQRVDKAHNRYVRSLKALAAVRRVDVTAIQVNIGGGPSTRAES